MATCIDHSCGNFVCRVAHGTWLMDFLSPVGMAGYPDPCWEPFEVTESAHLGRAS